MIPNLTIGDLMIDCADAERIRDFYAGITGFEKTAVYGCHALKTDFGMHILFAEIDIPYVPPVWPEEPGKQQKQMHLDFVTDDLPSAVNKAIRLGAVKAAEQYGDYYVTMLDPEGRPFCLCNKSKEKTGFDLYYEEKGWGKIPDLSVMVDCQKSEKLRGFYAQLTDWDQGFHSSVLIPDNKMIICFMESEGDFDYEPPVWPEEPGQLQKQMHFNFQADDLPSAVEEAIRLGAIKAAAQYGGGHFVTLIDTEGHPFCLCKKG
jgi:predicted enzyme related to lactoylglutathione lyase